MAVPTVRASVPTNVVPAGSTSIVVSKPTGLADGDIVLLLLASPANISSPVFPSGFSGSQIGTGRIDLARGWKHITNAAGEPSSYTVSWSGGGKATIVALAIVGADSAAPINAQGVTNDETFDTTLVLNGVTTSVDDTLLILWYNADHDNVTITGPGTQLAAANTSGTGANAKTDVERTSHAIAGATGNKNATTNSSRRGSSALLAIKPVVVLGSAVEPGTETETAQTVTPILSGGIVAVGSATETELAQAVAPLLAQAIAISAATESESASSVLASTPAPSAGYITLDGVGDSISTPDSTQLDITGDIEVRVCVAADQWHNGGIGANNRQTMIGKWVESTNQRSWKFSFQPGGTVEDPTLFPFFHWSANGSTGLTVQSQIELPRPTDGEPIWLRITFEPVVGGQRRWAFYWSDDPPETNPDSVNWTPLQQFTGNTNTSIFNSTSPVRIGHTTGVEAQFAGKFYYAEIRNGIGGTKVANPDPRTDDQGWSSPPTTDDFGNVWSFHGDAFWTGDPSTGATIPVVGAVESEASQLVSVLLLDQEIVVGAVTEGEQANAVSVLLPPLSTVGAGWGVPIGIS